MPTDKPRINVAFEEAEHDVIAEMSALRGLSKSAIVRMLIMGRLSKLDVAGYDKEAVEAYKEVVAEYSEIRSDMLKVFTSTGNNLNQIARKLNSKRDEIFTVGTTVPEVARLVREYNDKLDEVKDLLKRVHDELRRVS